MWLSDRRTLLLGALALGGCGFTPVYAPGGAGNTLQGRVGLDVPSNENEFAFNQRFEERMGGRVTQPTYQLKVKLQTSRQSLGATSIGNTTRYRLVGRAQYQLLDLSGAALISGRTDSFTGYSTTGATVSTLAARRDAQDRLMIILADQVIDALLLEAAVLP